MHKDRGGKASATAEKDLRTEISPVLTTGHKIMQYQNKEIIPPFPSTMAGARLTPALITLCNILIRKQEFAERKNKANASFGFMNLRGID